MLKLPNSILKLYEDLSDVFFFIVIMIVLFQSCYIIVLFLIVFSWKTFFSDFIGKEIIMPVSLINKYEIKYMKIDLRPWSSELKSLLIFSAFSLLNEQWQRWWSRPPVGKVCRCVFSYWWWENYRVSIMIIKRNSNQDFDVHRLGE